MKRYVKWSHILIKDEKNNRVRVIASKAGKAKEAVRSVKPIRSKLWRGKPLTLAEFKLETGRSHQIRVQAAYEGYPVLGDRKYGPTALTKINFPRPALHSFRISFPHPISGETLNFEDPLPADMKELG